MEFIGWACKRTDTGEWWHKTNGWNKSLPTIYEKKRFATCAGKYHIHRNQYDFIKTVKIQSIVIAVEEILND